MKHRIPILIIFCLMLSVISLPSYALQEESSLYGSIRPRFTYINAFQCYLSINTSGLAEVFVSLNATGVQVTEVKAYLQQYRNGVWKTVKSWSDTEAGTSCSLDKSWYITSGYAYRVLSYGYVYINGIMVESSTITSQTCNY